MGIVAPSNQRERAAHERRIGEMPMKLVVALFASAAVIVIGVPAASASGPAAPGKELLQLTCDGLGPITVSVQRGANANGAVQITDAAGHGIPVAATFTVTDLTTSAVIESDTSATGHGHGHPNQSATHCSGVLFEGPASDFFDTEFPQGVAPTDVIRFTLDGVAIYRLGG
jgi:hypothetical protein